MYICRHAKHPLFLSDINKTLIFSTYFFFEKYSNIKFGENLSSGIRVVLCGQMDMKLIVVFRYFAKALKMITWGSINDKIGLNKF
jgi:hypothetical protein